MGRQICFSPKHLKEDSVHVAFMRLLCEAALENYVLPSVSLTADLSLNDDGFGVCNYEVFV